eukprot:TRINITY_DN3287_c1_g1_i1.p1 TRINITY_DN3287_c1_g1~~TRINITY_DN3287_c1_g1_i1.p1  ORF type:complete len:498 (-),score=20.97 TRINITY_DN3287_c1_g1_i1:230-1723(-)
MLWTAEKTVEIRDNGLACLSKLAYVLVLTYIVLYEMLYQGAHLSTVQVSGVNQLHFEHPTMNYCDSVLETCIANFTWRNNTPYCKESPLPYAFQKKPCEYWTSQEAEIIDGDGVVLVTRARMYNATKLCQHGKAEGGLTCQDGRVWNYSLAKDIYVADVNRFYMWIEHAMTSSRRDFCVPSEKLNGRWWSCESEQCRYVELLPLPDDFGTAPASNVEQPPLQSSAQANASDSRATASFLELTALAKEKKSSIVRSEVSAGGSQSFMAKSRTRSRHVARRHAASSAHSVNTLKVDSATVEPFLLSRPGTDNKKAIDVLPMSYVLSSASIDLDHAYKTHTHRESGLVITFTITYRNTQADAFDFVGLRILPWSHPLQTRLPWDPFGFTRARYDMWGDANSQGYMRVQKENFTNNGGSYYMWQMNGIYIDVTQNGQMLVFSWSKFSVYFTTSIGLVSAAFHLTRVWASRQKSLRNLIVERYVARSDSGDYERVDSYEDPQ